jgi:hypothetical protein
MFDDLSSDPGNTTETWHQRHQAAHLSEQTDIVTLTAASAPWAV